MKVLLEHGGHFYASAESTVAARGNMLSGCLTVRPFIVNVMSQEHLEGISPNLAQTSFWTQGSADQILEVKRFKNSYTDYDKCQKSVQ